MNFRYYLTERPVSMGTQPKEMAKFNNFGGKKLVDEIKKEAYGYVEYNHALSQQEIKDYELVPSPANIVVKEADAAANKDNSVDNRNSNKSITEQAKDKIEAESKAFKNKILKMKPEQIYYKAGFILFMEATVFHVKQLAENEELCKLILKDGKTLEEAVKHIMTGVRNKCGQMGDLPVEEFYSLIWEYYKIEPEKAKKAMEEKPKIHDITVKNSVKPKFSKRAGPLQMSLFDLGGEK